MAKQKNKSRNSRNSRRSQSSKSSQPSLNPPQNPLHHPAPGRLWSANYELYRHLHEGDSHECQAYRVYESTILLAVEMIFGDKKPPEQKARPARLVESMDDARASRWFHNIETLLAAMDIELYRKPLLAEQVIIAVLDWLLHNRQESLERMERDIGHVKEFIDGNEPGVSSGHEEPSAMVPVGRNESLQNQSATQNPIIGTLFVCVEMLLLPQTRRGRPQRVNAVVGIPVFLYQDARGAQRASRRLPKTWGAICIVVLLIALFWVFGGVS